MLDLLFGALALLVVGLLGGIAVFTATELTVKSELFRPLRERLLWWGATATVRKETPENLKWYDGLAIFFADAWTCPFCCSFWHGFWVAAVIGCVTSNVGLALLAYPLEVGLAKLLHDATRRG